MSFEVGGRDWGSGIRIGTLESSSCRYGTEGWDGMAWHDMEIAREWSGLQWVGVGDTCRIGISSETGTIAPGTVFP